MTTSQRPRQSVQQPPTSRPPQQSWTKRPDQIPPQWAGQHAATPPIGGPPPPEWYAPQPPQPQPVSASWAPVQAAPRNGLGIAALCLGIVGMLFGLVPLTGFVAFGTGAVGVILGLVGFSRARKRIATNVKTAIAGAVLSIVAVALGVWGMVIVFAGFNQLAADLGSPSATGTGKPLPADVANPATAAPTTFQLEITGNAPKMMVSYGTADASSSSSAYQSLPWRKTVEAKGDLPFASVSATSFGPGTITCTITNTATGQVVDTKTSQTLDNSEYASANVSCNSMGY